MYYGRLTSHPLPPPRRQPSPEAAAAAAVALFVTVALGLSFGLFGGGGRVAVGPGSSRVVAVGSVASFMAGELKVRDISGGGVFLYELHGLPELNKVRNWTTTQRLTVGAHDQRGFSLWLNRGSSIRLTWIVIGGAPEEVGVNVLRGENRPELIEEYPTEVNASGKYGGEAVLSVEDDGSYFIGAANRGRHAAAVNFAAEISAVVHDVAPAASACSTAGGECKMKILMGRVNYAVIDAPPAPLAQVSRKTWSVELSFDLRLTGYMGLLGTLSVALWLILRYLLSCGDDPAADGGDAGGPVEAAKAPLPSYGALDEEGPSNSGDERRRSSDDLYDGKICVICFELQRNCFFTPCGHCVACNACAKRLLEEEGRACPICRRVIHKVRRLPAPLATFHRAPCIG